ncbi:DUF1572 family protein [Flagellimonas nanhaiensis]|uniref:DinB family protein n=1 Tax=Flagellimonas nanhaiensis TaxID=2292706 RepID=A0A371JPI2_9FLAO|nr:DUF1572 family protein [Allomuricauda nanhaiensis]RDY59391.1 DinB family protein [Allomuricauda nanhaiensis]
MIIESIKELYYRDLRRLKQEIELYKDDTTLWKTERSIKNSGGNLCLHIVGNLKTYIGNGLAQIGYVRQRDLEFSDKFVDREELYKRIDETIQIVDQGLSKLDDDRLTEDFPIIIWEKKTEMAFTIIHLHSHLNYHLGQINYHRRILEET